MFKFKSWDPIPHNLHGRVKDNKDNNSFEKTRDTDSLKRRINEITMDAIVGFLQINFSYYPLPTLVAFHKMDDFLGDDNVIDNIPPNDKTCLLWRDNIEEDKLKTVRDYLYI